MRSLHSTDIEVQMSWLDQITNYVKGIGEEKKKEEKPKASPTPAPDKSKTMKNANDIIMGNSSSKSSSSSTKKATPVPVQIPSSKGISLSEVPDPRSQQAYDPNDREVAVDNFINNKNISSMLEGLIGGANIGDVNLTDNNPKRSNLEIADEFLFDTKDDENFTSRGDRYRTRDRTDLSPAMALADFWTGGKSNLAAAYKAPQSADEVYEKMLALRGKETAARDKAELDKYSENVDAYKKLAVDPLTDVIKAHAQIYNSTGKNDAGTLRSMIQAVQSGNNKYSDNLTEVLVKNLMDSTKRDISNASLRQRAEEVAARADRETGGKPQDFNKQIDNEITTYLAPVFLGKALPPNRELWSAKEQKAVGAISKFVDAVVVDLELDKRYPIQEARMRAIQSINMAKPSAPDGSWRDPVIADIFKRYKSGK